ncbi:PaaI family thioesterase [Roseobacter weihaiensis]|uniref:PaaI family thioesterase n=1 Tax=Roseobacter weihaiensis TaxID=2763262 RepID=UPI001D0BC34F|nr:PaaI family thioesterase [Roseobacter sp. H9]
MSLKMDLETLSAFIDQVFEQVRGEFTLEALEEETLRVRLNVKEKHLRPGGTVSGPAMFALADVAAYYMTLARIGPEALAVTTNCAIDFMRKPQAGVDIVAEARLLKLGRQLSVTDVLLYSEGAPKPVARASLTYSIPPRQ